MIHIFICSKCEEVRMVSRYRSAACLRCGESMSMSDIPYLRWTELDEDERRRAVSRHVAALSAQKARTN